MMEEGTSEKRLDDVTITRLVNGYTVRVSYAHHRDGACVGFSSEVFIAKDRGEALVRVFEILHGIGEGQ